MSSPFTEAQYRAAPGLSNSAMKDLAVSPLRFWFCHVNPNKPELRETPEMAIGQALHCAVLEPSEFDKRYCCEVNPDDYPGLLRTMDDLKRWLAERGLPSTAKLKADLVKRVQETEATVPILDVLEARHADENAGKSQFKRDDWERIRGMAEALKAEPKLQEILEGGGEAEIPMFAGDPDTGVLLKARMDFISPDFTLDLKTFSQTRGNSIDRTVTNAIWYEKYYVQAYWYSYLRSLQPSFEKQGIAALAPPFVIAFVESDPPHEVRLRSLLPKIGGEVNLLWEKARLECRGLVRLYADCVERWGDNPWRETRDVDPVRDEEFPSLSYY
jgi:hypothetical protein